MSETAVAQGATPDTKGDSAKKITVRTLATEINVSHETLISFLQKKGYTSVKTIMSKIEPDALDAVMKQFGKDKDVAEKRHKKLAAFKEQRAKTREDYLSDHPDQRRTEEPGTAEVAAPVTAPPVAAPIVAASPVTPSAPIEVSAPETIELPPVEAPEPVAPDLVAAAATPTEVEVPEAQTPEAAEPEVEAQPAAEIATEVEPEPVEEVSVVAEGPAPETEIAEGAEGGTATHGPEGAGGIRRKHRRKTVIATGDPMDLRVALPGLKIKGKIELEPKEQPQLRTRGADGRLGTKLKGLATKHAPTTAKPAGTGEEGEIVKKRRGKSVDARDVKDAVRRTLAGIDESSALSRRAKARRARRSERAEEQERRGAEEAARDRTVINATEFLTANELANLMNVDVGDIISKCIALGLMVSINQRLEKDTIQLVADEFGYSVEFQDEFTTETLDDTPDEPETLKSRPPVVTIMGHVDHGKTSLLDYIRKANVVAGESGGITQHIGAYEVTNSLGHRIAFLDTPGHEAFTAMRARGAQVTDLVVLVIAADDSVMPQTLEAISHAQAASVPIIIALNKTDRADANPDRIRQQLADRNVLVESWGGKYGEVELSARTGKGVDKLLERISLEAELLELKANPDRTARGVIIEAEVDKGRGIQATILVQKGTLRMGDPFLAGIYSGRVRAMFDERGNKKEIAGPSTPVQILGFDGIPAAGDQFIVLASDSEAKEISSRRQQLKREQDFKQVRFLTLDDISEQIKQGGVQHLRLVLKGDVDGSVEALADALQRLSTPEVQVEMVHRAVGAISENDVRLAAASGAIILGFHVRPNLDARRLAALEHVEIRLYSVIYDCINEVRDALEGLLSPEEKEEVTATVEVRDTFKVPKAGMVAGCYVVDGKIARGNKVRLLRDGVEVWTGGLASLRRFKDDVRDVDSGYECGISLENFNDIKPGDIIEAYKIVEIKRTLEKVAAAR
ncbi:MAG: translation initiation factor IF-2 [Bacteroidota bacterium]|nr:translation initiation factor IF-2 [Bacteroidota bacterium]MDP4232714.1 translation initiation factor IF-2 [Bacteroidota bacterium]MDP4243153.1 translation initiation factor IF-2 [Bacteroidota bacterium]MDP4287610.1 translation initiation factor IF-2 [Bacteroidota bacterium]